MAGTKTAICPLVEKPSARPNAARAMFTILLSWMNTINCQLAKAIEAVSIASIRTSLLARIKANAEAMISAESLPTSVLYKALPSRKWSKRLKQ